GGRAGRTQRDCGRRAGEHNHDGSARDAPRGHRGRDRDPPRPQERWHSRAGPRSGTGCAGTDRALSGAAGAATRPHSGSLDREGINIRTGIAEARTNAPRAPTPKGCGRAHSRNGGLTVVASISARGGVQAALQYYAHLGQDDYYLRDGEPPGGWAWEGAARRS